MLRRVAPRKVRWQDLSPDARRRLLEPVVSPEFHGAVAPAALRAAAPPISVRAAATRARRRGAARARQYRRRQCARAGARPVPQRRSLRRRGGGGRTARRHDPRIHIAGACSRRAWARCRTGRGARRPARRHWCWRASATSTISARTRSRSSPATSCAAGRCWGRGLRDRAVRRRFRRAGRGRPRTAARRVRRRTPGRRPASRDPPHHVLRDRPRKYAALRRAAAGAPRGCRAASCASWSTKVERPRLRPRADALPHARRRCARPGVPGGHGDRAGSLRLRVPQLAADRRRESRGAERHGHVAREEFARTAKAESGQLGPRDMARFGAGLARLLLPASVREGLETMQRRPLVVVHDGEGSRIPWEALRVGDVHPALEGGLTRATRAKRSPSPAGASSTRTAALRVLMVVDPTLDLPGAADEGAALGRMLRAGGAEVDCSPARRHAQCAAAGDRRGPARRPALRGPWILRPGHPGRSGLVCAGQEILRGATSRASATCRRWCSSMPARPRACADPRSARSRLFAFRRSTSVAEAFLAGGVANFLGTHWPVGDQAALAFSTYFYRDCSMARRSATASSRRGAACCARLDRLGGLRPVRQSRLHRRQPEPRLTSGLVPRIPAGPLAPRPCLHKKPDFRHSKQ